VLVGRLIASGLIIFFVLFLFSKFNLGAALSRLKRPLPLISVLVLFLLGLASGARADDGRALRPFVSTDFYDAQISIYVPAKPKWTSAVEPRSGTHALLLTTPAKYYPPASIEIVHNHRLRVNDQEFKATAVKALNTVREKAGVIERIGLFEVTPVTYGEIEGYQDDYTIGHDDQIYSVRSVVGRFSNGAPVTFFLATSEGQLNHITHMSTKIWNNTHPLVKD